MLRERLGNLQAAEFLYEKSIYPDLEYTFKHALTHEVAYGSLLQERRKALHSRIMESLERLSRDRQAEQVEGLGTTHCAERCGTRPYAIYVKLAIEHMAGQPFARRPLPTLRRWPPSHTCPKTRRVSSRRLICTS